MNERFVPLHEVHHHLITFDQSKWRDVLYAARRRQLSPRAFINQVIATAITQEQIDHALLEEKRDLESKPAPPPPTQEQN